MDHDSTMDMDLDLEMYSSLSPVSDPNQDSDWSDSEIGRNPSDIPTMYCTRRRWLRRRRRQIRKRKGKKVVDEVTASVNSMHLADLDNQRVNETELGNNRETSPAERKLYSVWTIENFQNEKQGLEYIISLLKKVCRCDDPTKLVDDNICHAGIFYLHLTEEEAISLADMDTVQDVELDSMDMKFLILE